MIAHAYKPKKSRIWRARIRLQDETRITDISLDTRDHQVAIERLRKIVAEKEKEKEGLILPGTIRTASRKDLADHLDDYVADLDKAQRSESHVYHVEKRIRRLMAECLWRRCGDMSADSFQAWRVKQNGKSAKTLNEFVSSASSFCNWMVRQQRMVANPLKFVSRVTTKGKEVVKRRAFTDNEMQRLLTVAGPRRIVYLTAVNTGLRRGELAALQWGDVDLNDAEAVIRVRASTTKNGLAANLSIQPVLEKELRQYRPVCWSSEDLVFADGVASMKVFKKDLMSAGISYIDSQVRRCDFHALIVDALLVWLKQGNKKHHPLLRAQLRHW